MKKIWCRFPRVWMKPFKFDCNQRSIRFRPSLATAPKLWFLNWNTSLSVSRARTAGRPGFAGIEGMSVQPEQPADDHFRGELSGLRRTPSPTFSSNFYYKVSITCDGVAAQVSGFSRFPEIHHVQQEWKRCSVGCWSDEHRSEWIMIDLIPINSFPSQIISIESCLIPCPLQSTGGQSAANYRLKTAHASHPLHSHPISIIPTGDDRPNMKTCCFVNNIDLYRWSLLGRPLSMSWHAIAKYCPHEKATFEYANQHLLWYHILHHLTSMINDPRPVRCPGLAEEP